MSQWAKFFLFKHEDMHSVPSSLVKSAQWCTSYLQPQLWAGKSTSGWEGGACWPAHLAI